MKYNKHNFTYGCELEFADVNITNKLPNGCSWNTKDYSIVNSNGIANDPTGKLYKYGGEINTKPTNTILEQIKIIDEVIKNLKPKPIINYKCNLHIHIGVPGLENDLNGLKNILKFAYEIPENIWDIIDPIEKPTKELFSDEDEFKSAKKRYRRNLISHRCKPTIKKFKEIMEAKTIKEFFDKHAIEKNGILYWAISPRHGINIRQMKETKTIEFRHFFGTFDLKEYESCLIWCREFIFSSLNDLILISTTDLIFPKPMRYNHKLNIGFNLTNHHNNKKLEILKNINLILNKKL